jgi:predicted nucleic acid-binding protein
MAKKSDIVICDTDVIIEAFRNNKQVIDELAKIEYNNIAISIITFAELLAGARNKIEFNRIYKQVSTINILEINSHISNIFNKLITDYSLSHSIGIPDSLIAATAIYYSTELFTFNRKHFHFIPELKLYNL